MQARELKKIAKEHSDLNNEELALLTLSLMSKKEFERMVRSILRLTFREIRQRESRNEEIVCEQ